MEQSMKNGLSKVMLVILMASGADIAAPEERKRQIIKNLGLTNNSNFTGVDEDLNQVENQKEKLAIIKAIILSHLTISQMMGLHDVIHDEVEARLEYVKAHPEVRESNPNLGEALEELFESDL